MTTLGPEVMDLLRVEFARLDARFDRLDAGLAELSRLLTLIEGHIDASRADIARCQLTISRDKGTLPH